MLQQDKVLKHAVHIILYVALTDRLASICLLHAHHTLHWLLGKDSKPTAQDSVSLNLLDVVGVVVLLVPQEVAINYLALGLISQHVIIIKQVVNIMGMLVCK